MVEFDVTANIMDYYIVYVKGLHEILWIRNGDEEDQTKTVDCAYKKWGKKDVKPMC